LVGKLERGHQVGENIKMEFKEICEIVDGISFLSG
jgi:hypothetical protein